MSTQPIDTDGTVVRVQAEHTPGPWSWYCPRFLTVNPSECAFVVGPESRYMDHSSGFVIADAQLIAAAPDLLQALTEWMSHLDSEAGGPNDTFEYEQALMANMRSAIAKATGSAT